MRKRSPYLFNNRTYWLFGHNQDRLVLDLYRDLFHDKIPSLNPSSFRASFLTEEAA
jgi:hypothetical protein